MTRKLLYVSILSLLAFAWIGPAAPAGDPAQEPEAAPAASGAASSEPDAEPGTEPTGREAGGGDAALDVFIPSEKLPADSAISFPVDI